MIGESQPELAIVLDEGVGDAYGPAILGGPHEYGFEGVLHHRIDFLFAEGVDRYDFMIVSSYHFF